MLMTVLVVGFLISYGILLLLEFKDRAGHRACWPSGVGWICTGILLLALLYSVSDHYRERSEMWGAWRRHWDEDWQEERERFLAVMVNEADAEYRRLDAAWHPPPPPERRKWTVPHGWTGGR